MRNPIAHRVVAIFSCVCLVWQQVAFAVATPEPIVIDPAALKASVNSAFEGIARLQSALDTSQFDNEELVDRLDFEPELIIGFVTNHIAFEQYSGLLRGINGTLMSRAGNSLDQSMLLASLLKDAGFDATIRGGVLDEEQLAYLLGELQPRAGTDLDGHVSDEFRAALDALFEELSIDDSARSTAEGSLTSAALSSDDPLIARTNAATSFLSGALSKEGVELPAIELGQSIGGEASQYFWVEYRDQAADNWVAIQPVFSKNAPLAELPEATLTLADEIPAELQHRIRLQVFIEQKLGGKLVTHAVTSPWERPAANLNLMPLTFVNVPQALTGDLQSFPPPEKILEESSYFAPSLSGETFGGLQAFDLAGNIIDPTAAGTAQAGVFKEVNRAFGSAVGALTGEGESATMLTAQWIEFTFISPGGGEKTIRRYTYDALGAAKRAAGDLSGLTGDRPVPYSLLHRHTLMVSVGAVPKAIEISRSIQDFIDMRPVFDAFADAVAGKEPSPAAMTKLMNELPAHWIGMLPLVSDLEAASALQGDSLVYRSQPALTLFSEGPSSASRSQRYVDIVRNPRTAISFAAGSARLNPTENMRAGIWDTLVENHLLSTLEFQARGAHKSTKLAMDAGIPLVVVRESADVKTLSVDEDSRHFIDADIANGYLALVPKSLPPGQDFQTWWRVDPVTGETLGMGFGGRGVALVERETLELIGQLISIGALYAGWYECFQDTRNSARFLCCLVMNLVMYYGGVGWGTVEWAHHVIGFLFGVAYDFVSYQADPCGWAFPDPPPPPPPPQPPTECPPDDPECAL